MSIDCLQGMLYLMMNVYTLNLDEEQLFPSSRGDGMDCRKPKTEVGPGDMVFWYLVLLGVTVYFICTYLCIGSDLLIQFEKFIWKATTTLCVDTSAGPSSLGRKSYSMRYTT
jgi:hypothetical protein